MTLRKPVIDRQHSVTLHRHDDDVDDDALSEESTEEVSAVINDWKNPAFSLPDTDVLSVSMTTAAGRRTAAAAAMSSSRRFTKQMLSSVQVLCPVDNKFIACLINSPASPSSAGGSLLVLFDQHAVDERIRLERFTRGCYQDDESWTTVKTAVLSSVTSLQLTDDVVQLMCRHRRSLRQSGVQFRVDAVNSSHVWLYAVPMCLLHAAAAVDDHSTTALLQRSLLLLISDHLQHDVTDDVDVVKRLSTVVHETLSSAACHGAIKFGERLSRSQCVQLIEQLSTCQLPFQCAHGRPALIPVLDLQLVTSAFSYVESGAPRLWKLKKNDR